MGARLIELPWDSQPQEAVGGLGYGAIAAVLPKGASVLNIAPGGHAEPLAERTGVGVGVAIGRLGHGAGAPSPTTNVYRLHSVANELGTVWERPVNQVTALVYLIRTGNADGNAPIFSNGSPGTSPFAAWGLIDADGTGTARFECSAGNTYRSVTSSIGMTNNTPTVLVGRYNGEVAEIFQDGTQRGSVACSGALTYPNNGGDRGPALSNFWNFTVSRRAFVGRVFVAALWDRALSNVEIAELSANPWQLFAPQQIYIPRSVVAPALPTLSAPTAIDITASSFRPRVTYAY
jgi:hypothetical protein